MDIILLMIAGVVWAFRSAKKQEKASGGAEKADLGSVLQTMGKQAGKLAGNMEKSFRGLSESDTKKTVRSRVVQNKKATGARFAEARQERREEWAEAREYQSDAARVHGRGVDSCEGRLESLKVLYDAGILDKDEYQIRVQRTKARHRRA